LFQAFREVFEYLIEDFKTYRPLLAAIKNEYEMMINFQKGEIRRLEPLRVSAVEISRYSRRGFRKNYSFYSGSSSKSTNEVKPLL